MGNIYIDYYHLLNSHTNQDQRKIAILQELLYVIFFQFVIISNVIIIMILKFNYLYLKEN